MGSSKRKRNVDGGVESEKKGKESLDGKGETALNEKSAKQRIVASSWLDNFLSQKRDSTVSIPDEHSLADDTYLREFSMQFAKSSGHDKGTESDSEFVGEELVSFEVCEISIASHEELPLVIDDAEDLSLIVTNGKLRLFNLPYRIKSKEITDLFSKYGFNVLNVTMDIDKRTSLPAGSGTVELAPGSDEAVIIKTLQGQICGGRPLKVLKLTVKKSRPSGGRADRYFLGDSVSDLKCNSCGMGGHKAADCDADQFNPCHLCAAKDHESGDCPNITCFRCGEFGHHSKTCSNAKKLSRAFICTLCASSTHDSRHCLQLPEKAQARVEDKTIRCMRCNQLGHALCEQSSSKKKKTKGVFCPNCGEEGHHVDYPNDPTSRAGSILGGFNVCQAPKYDAYVKFPQLLRNIDHVGSSVGDKESTLEYYQSLVWSAGSGEQVQSLFPSLCRNRPMGGGNGNEDMRRNSVGNLNLSERSNMNENSNRRGIGEGYRRESYSASSSSSYRDSSVRDREYRADTHRASDIGGRDNSSRGGKATYSRNSTGYPIQESFGNIRTDRHVTSSRVEEHDGQRTFQRTVYNDSLPRRASSSNYENIRESGRITRRY